MTFKQGKPKTGGRKKGTPNKKTLLKVEAYLSQANFHPVEQIIKLIPNLPAEEAVKACFNLLKYIQPEYRPTEGTHSQDEDPEENPLDDLSEAELIKLVAKE